MKTKERKSGLTNWKAIIANFNKLEKKIRSEERQSTIKKIREWVGKNKRQRTFKHPSVATEYEINRLDEKYNKALSDLEQFLNKL